MKSKLFLLTICAFLGITVQAQLKVFSNGKVGVASTSTSYGALQIGTDGTTNGLSLYDASTGGSTLSFYRKNNIGYITRASNDNYGLRIFSNGNIGMGNGNTSADAALNLCASNGAVLKTTAWMSYSGTEAMRVDIGGTSSAITYAGSFMGTRTFFVQADGQVWAYGSWLTSSDSANKKEIEPIAMASEKVMLLNGVTYKYKKQLLDTTKAKSGADVSDETIEKMEKDKQKKKIGLIAQEVEQVVPEVVKTLPDGSKAIAYSELTALLIEAFKEQQKEIEDLKEALTGKTKSKAAYETGNLDESIGLNATLHQNVPNPFTSDTKINLYLPEQVSIAQLMVFDMQGKPVKSFDVAQRGDVSIIIEGSELPAGMYIYSLISDNQEVATKRMILTE